MAAAADGSSPPPDYGERITEGKADVYLPKSVFYNPVQEFNRDLTILVISEYEKVLREEKTAKKLKKAQKEGWHNSIKVFIFHTDRGCEL